MNNEKWKRAVEKLVPLTSEIGSILDDDLAEVSIAVGKDGYLHIQTMVDGMIYSAYRVFVDSPVHVDEPF